MTFDTLSDYPCAVSGNCSTECPWDLGAPCEFLGIYRQLIALRAAVLGDMTPEEAAEVYRTTGRIVKAHGAHLDALADVAAGL